MKFILEFIPSIILVYLTYRICIFMYNDKRIALISSFLMSVLWVIMFNTFRFHVDIPALFFAFLTIFVFWQGFERKEKIFGKIDYNWAIPLVISLLVVAYSIRRAYALFGIIFLVYILSTRNLKELIKEKYNWVGVGIGVILFLIVERFVFTSGLGKVAGIYYGGGKDLPFSLVPFQIFGTYFDSINLGINIHILKYLFFIGFIVIIFRLILSLGHFKEDRFIESRSDLFAFLTVFLTMVYFLFFQKTLTVGDPRWYLPLILGSFIFISKGVLTIADFSERYQKYLPVLIVVLLIGYGGYYELQHADFIIKNKVSSYSGIKDAGIFLKEISNPNDLIISTPAPQMSYYSERSSYDPGALMRIHPTKITFEEFIQLLNKNTNINYIVISFSEPNNPSWMRKESEEYVRNPQTGQIVLEKWEIPFMNTTINFMTGQQDIKQEVSYGNISFRLLTVKNEVFVYGVVRK